MLQQQLVPRPNFKTSASILHNYKEFLTELKRTTQKSEPVIFRASDLAKEKKVKGTIFKVLVKLKVIKMASDYRIPGVTGRKVSYQWIMLVEITDKFVQKIYDKCHEEQQKLAFARTLPGYVPKRVSKKTGLPKLKTGPKSASDEVIKLLDDRNKADEIAISEISKSGKGSLTAAKARIKVSGIIFAPKQLQMMGEKKMEKSSTVQVDRCYTFEGVTKILFELEQTELRVVFIKEARIKVQEAFGITPAIWNDTLDIVGTLTLKNKTIAMSQRFSDDKQGAFWIETVEM